MYIVLKPIVSGLSDTLIGLEDSIPGVTKEIQKLRETLFLIQDVLNDAEQRQITEQSVKLWLRDLRDVMYDADDILDEYRIAAKEGVSKEKQSLRRRTLHCFSRLRHVKSIDPIGYKIRNLNKRLGKTWAYISKFDLKLSDGRRVVIRASRETSEVEVEHDIVGEAIEKNTRDLVDLLIREDEYANANTLVLAIVGIDGIGKTTLAQKIFNDDKIKAVFQKTMWVCVSQEFAETDLLWGMITIVGGRPGEARTIADLQDMLMHLLKNKKFLLVLDDVLDAQIWEDGLRKPLQVGAVGSRVLVTTRNKGVADRMKANHIHHMTALSSDDSWLLLRKKVTKNAEEERDVEILKDIGMRIVEKCQGLPLAITVIGGVLCGEFRRWKWKKVERSSIWSWTGLPEGVHQALYLSYEDLPSHLKQCFLHCSLFRKDSLIDRETLVQLWVAEGFVVKVEGEEEKIAEQYYDELIQRSLLEGCREGIQGHTRCKMHKLLRSFCQLLTRGDSSVIENIDQLNADNDSIKLRRLSVVAAPDSKNIRSFLRSTQSYTSVRTLLLEKLTYLDDEDVDNYFKNLHLLRVVHLGSTMIQSLPESVKNLVHLRYLNLSGCSQMKTLPESIGGLIYLQFLILQGCSQMKTLPESIGGLIYLQFLILQGCTKLVTLPKGLVKLCKLRTLNLLDVPLEGLPSGMANLQHLNVLKGAVVSSISGNSSSSLCSLEEISKLQKLKELSIHKLRMVSDESEQNINALNGLMAFEKLVALDLFCGSLGHSKQDVASYTDEETIRIEKIFDVALCPPWSVRQIQIHNFFGRQFPQWLMSSNKFSSYLPLLTNLIIQDCHSCSLLPPLGKLWNLEFLDISGLDAITRIGAEFFGYEEASTQVGNESGGSKSASSSLPLFPRLKHLYLSSLSNLEEWHWMPEDGETVALPQLNELRVYSCTKLLSLPEELSRQAIHLTKLSIGTTNLNSISGFPSIKNLSINNGTGLKIVSRLPALAMLEVSLEEEQSLSLPDWLAEGLPNFTSLQRLDLICKNKQLLYKCLQDGTYWPKIRHIPFVEISDQNGNYITYIKHSSTFLTNII